MMQKLYLHIGTGKTGSTSIQRTLSKVRGDFYFFSDSENGAKIFDNPDEFKARLEAGREYKKIIYSSEWSYLADAAAVKALHESISTDFDVEVIIYFRRQDEFEVSRYQQVAKHGDGLSRGGQGAIPTFSAVELNYFDIAEKWGQFFNVTVRIFQRSKLVDGDVVLDFASLVGVNVAPSEVIRANESAGIVEVKLGHIINQLKLHHLKPVLLKGAPPSAPSKASAEQMRLFYEQFKYSNQQLFDKYLNGIQGFDEDFSRYPKRNEDMWNEDTADAAIRHVLIKLSDGIFDESKAVQDRNVELLRDAAIALESSDLRLSLRLMTLAHKYRPYGELINQKLSTYDCALKAGKLTLAVNIEQPRSGSGDATKNLFVFFNRFLKRVLSKK
ncbi:hypothetical protein G3R49_02355 [Shewanella sp. WXL01]|uniref:Sulfotransferase domain-containing protein n=1 Tax=Shewanella maritima TaxID=2520507 RepID=A0A411PFU9_9GAMM|nr:MULTISPECIES: hypothetical protein [Shewanella]NKF49423.1 hypothetical protein [Shewanella sp. WXL01]QBF82469.1 hypothetical protein EXU30_06975 [Shewanella maritima]